MVSSILQYDVSEQETFSDPYNRWLIPENSGPGTVSFGTYSPTKQQSEHNPTPGSAIPQGLQDIDATSANKVEAIGNFRVLYLLYKSSSSRMLTRKAISSSS